MSVGGSGVRVTLKKPADSADSGFLETWCPCWLCSWTSQPSAASRAFRSPATHHGAHCYFNVKPQPRVNRLMQTATRVRRDEK